MTNDEHVPTYRNADSGEPDEGPTTRMDRLWAWWDHGEFENPKKVYGACAVGVLLAVMPFTWRAASIIVGLPTLLAIVVLVLFGLISMFVHPSLDSGEKQACRKIMLISGVTVAIGFPILMVINPLGVAEKAASDAAEEQENLQEFERRCQEHFYLKEMPLPQASCPTNEGTC